jgi:hypothetical protein
MPDPLENPDSEAGDEYATLAWDVDPPPEDPDAPRQRHDAFTEARKAQFLKVLVKTGCILDACRESGVGARTVYRHQDSDPRFADHCRLALRMSATPIELTAWARAVEGVEQQFACGGEIHVRRRYDAGLLRLLLQGSNPKKYGPRPGFTRKRILKHERKEMEREIRAEYTKVASLDETCVELAKRIRAFGIRTDREEEAHKLANGWTRSPAGDWVPPGYAPIEGGAPCLSDAEEMDGPGAAIAWACDPPQSM